MHRRLALLFAVALCLVGAFSVTGFASGIVPFVGGGSTTLEFDGPDGPVANGSTFTVDVVVSDVTNLGAFDFTLTFDNAKLQYLGLIDTGYLTSTGRTATCIRPAFGPNGETREEIANLYGALHFGCATFGLAGSSNNGPSGDAVLATLTFRAKSPGDAALNFVGLTDPYIIGGDPINPIDAGFTGLASVEDCSGPVCSDIDIAFDVLDAVVVVADATTPTPTNTPVFFPPIATPTTGFYAAIDCDTATAGLQSACFYEAGVGQVTVDVVLVNVDRPAVQISAWQFDLVAQPQTFFDPIAAPDMAAAFDTSDWNCSLLAPTRDRNGDPVIADSSAACFVGIGGTSHTSIGPGGTIVLGSVTYSADEPRADLHLESVSVGSRDDTLVDSCYLYPTSNSACVPGIVHVGAGIGGVPTSTATPTNTPTATSTATLPAPRTPAVSPTGAVSAVIGLNQDACLWLSLLSAPITASNVAFNCASMQVQNSLQSVFGCMHGADTDGDGVIDQCDFPDPSDPFQPAATDFDFATRDADQVHAGQVMYAIALVDGDYPVLFSTDAGELLTINGDFAEAEWLCYANGFWDDPDCDANTETHGDGVVVARVFIDPDTARGAHHVTVTQNNVSQVLDFTVVGPPQSIQVEIVDKDQIDVGATDCPYALDPDEVAGDATKTFVIARALDSDGVRVASSVLEWEFLYGGLNFGSRFYRAYSDIGGAASLHTPTFDLGGDLGIGAPQVICSRSTASTLVERAAFAVPLSSAYANFAAIGSVAIGVGGPPGPIPTPYRPPNAEHGPLILLNSTTCSNATMAFGAGVSHPYTYCHELHGPGMDNLVSCLRGPDLDGDGRSDNCNAGALGRFTPRDLDKINLDGNQVTQGDFLWALYFVDDGEPVSFETTKGTLPYSQAQTFACDSGYDEDCAASARGDGVIAVGFQIDQEEPTGPGAVIVHTSHGDVEQAFRVVGPPAVITAEFVNGDDTVLTGDGMCAPPPSYEAALDLIANGTDDPDKTVMLARAFDGDGTALSSTYLRFGPPPWIAAPASPSAPLVDLGGGDAGAVQVFCGWTPGETTVFADYYYVSAGLDLTVLDGHPTPTVVPNSTPPSGFSLAVDCDSVGFADTSIQSDCVFPFDTPGHQSSVVLTNNTDTDSSIGSFEFTLQAFGGPASTSTLHMNPALSAGGASFDCTTYPPTQDPEALTCFRNIGSSPGPSLPAHSSVVLADAFYMYPGNVLAVFGLSSGYVASNDTSALIGDCIDEVASAPACFGARVQSGDVAGSTATPTITPTPTSTPTSTPTVTPTPRSAFAMEVDCDSGGFADTSVQSACSFPSGTGGHLVSVVLTNHTDVASSIGSLSFVLNAGGGLTSASTPNLNPALQAGGANFNCTLLPPTQNPESLTCFLNIGSPPGPALPAHSSVVLGDVFYAFPGDVGAALLLSSGVVGTNGGNALIEDCFDDATSGDACFDATVRVGNPAPTWTATSAPTVTPTPTQGPFPTVTPTAIGGGGSAGSVAIGCEFLVGAIDGDPDDVPFASDFFEACDGIDEADAAHLADGLGDQDGALEESDFSEVDVDANQISKDSTNYRGQIYMFVFVDDEGPVLIDGTIGLRQTPVDASGTPLLVEGSDWLCDSALEDKDCDASSDGGDGVVVSRLGASEYPDIGDTYTVNAGLSGDRYTSQDITIVGTADALIIEGEQAPGISPLGGGDIFVQRSTDVDACNDQLDVTSADEIDEPNITVVRVRVLDTGGTEITREPVFISSSDTSVLPLEDDGGEPGSEPKATSGVSVDGGTYGVAYFAHICGGETTGTSQLTAVINRGDPNHEESGAINLNVYEPEDETPMSTPTPTQVPTMTPTPTIEVSATAATEPSGTASPVGSGTPTGPSGTVTPSGTGTAVGSRTPAGPSGTASPGGTSTAVGSLTAVPTVTPTATIVSGTASPTVTVAASPTRTATTASGTASATPRATKTAGGGSSTKTRTPVASATSPVSSATGAAATATRVSSVLGGAATPRTGILLPDTGEGDAGSGGVLVGLMLTVLSAAALASIAAGHAGSSAVDRDSSRCVRTCCCDDE